MEHFCDMCDEQQDEFVLELLNEFVDNFYLGERGGAPFLLICDAGWEEIEAIGEEASKRIGEEVSFDELVSVLLERCTDWGFNDQYIKCCGCDCSNIIYLHGDYYWLTEGEIFCEDCVKTKYAEEYLEAIANNPDNANTMLDEEYILKQGYIELDREWESGFYGIRHDPEKVMEELWGKGWDKVIFNFKEGSPFVIRWNAFVKKEGGKGDQEGENII